MDLIVRKDKIYFKTLWNTWFLLLISPEIFNEHQLCTKFLEYNIEQDSLKPQRHTDNGWLPSSEFSAGPFITICGINLGICNFRKTAFKAACLLPSPYQPVQIFSSVN